MYLQFNHFNLIYLYYDNYIHHIWIYDYLIILSGDMKSNPGPKPNSLKSFSIRQGNLNSIPKLSYLTIHEFNIIYLSETYLHSTYQSDD